MACSQQTHLLRSASLRVIQASHSHFEAFCWATNDLKPASVVSIFGAAGAAVAAAAATPGFFVQQATHSLASFLLRTIQAEHSQVSDLGLKASPKVFFIVGNVLVEGKAGFGTVAAAGFERGVSHATHFSSVSLFLNIQAEHSHSFAGFLNMSPKLEGVDVGVDGGFSEACFLSASRTLPVLS